MLNPQTLMSVVLEWIDVNKSVRIRMDLTPVLVGQDSDLRVMEYSVKVRNIIVTYKCTLCYLNML